MISFSDSESQTILRQTVREFVERTIAPCDREWDAKMASLPHLGEEIGLYGLCSDSGLSLFDALIVLEELGRGSGSFAFSIAMLNFCEQAMARPNARLGCRAAATLPQLASSRFVLAVAAIALGRARQALELATRYAKERQQFGRPLSDNQAIQFMLASSATELDAAALLIGRAALTESSPDIAKANRGSMSAALAACDRALQIFGGAGYTREVPIERALRDCQFLAQNFGTPSFQLIAESLGG